MKYLLAFLLVTCLVYTPVQAQTDDPTAIALERIEEAGRTNADSLDLSFLGLSAIPPEIGQLSHLENLDLSNNKLQDLPLEIGQLSALEELDLSENQLPTLPSTLGDLLSLNRLSLDNNPLTQLPPELVRLSALEWLSLQGTQILDLPVMLGQMPNLMTVVCADGTMRTVPLVIDVPHLPGVSYQDTLSPLSPESDALLFQVRTYQGTPTYYDVNTYIWDVSTNTVMRLDVADIDVGALRGMAWSPQGTYLVLLFFPDTVTPDNVFDTFRVWNMATAQATTSHAGSGVVLSWSPDETYLAYEIYISGHMAGSIYSLVVCWADGTQCRDAGHSPDYTGGWMGIFYAIGPLSWPSDNLLLIDAGTLEHAAYYVVSADTFDWEPFTGPIPDTGSPEPTVEEEAAGLLSPSGLWRARIPGKDNDQRLGTPWLVLENTATGEVYQLPLPADTVDVNSIMWRPANSP